MKTTMPEIINAKEANEHLIKVGRELAQAETDRKTAFISHTLGDGRTFHKGDWNELLEPEQSALVTSSLQSIIDYLGANPDGLALDKVIVHVYSSTEVAVRSVPFGPFKQRCNYVRAAAVLPRHRFGSWTNPDEFVPYLQSCFCPSPEGGEDALSSLIAVSSNIVDTTELTLKDDGISQEATLRQGAARKGRSDVPNPVVLYPFSTFAEVDQPPRKFVFRLKSDPLQCILIEADGGAWQLTALQGIATWLRERLPEQVKVLA